MLQQLLTENDPLGPILLESPSARQAADRLREWVLHTLQDRPAALAFQTGQKTDRDTFEQLDWRDYAAVRLLDYIAHGGRQFEDLNLRGDMAYSDPIGLLWLAANQGTGGARPEFFEDMIHLFRQFTGREQRRMPSLHQLQSWMDRHPSGLDERIIALRERNRERILRILIGHIDAGRIQHPRFRFDPGMSSGDKLSRGLEWWNDHTFHLHFAVRSPDLLNELLDNSLDPDTLQVMHEAERVGIPFFVNPYYLSLLNVHAPDFAIGADLAIRDYVIYSRPLIEEFGHIVAWEKEDLVRPGKPNAAGWLLPSQSSIHRRYPEVAILIPDTVGKACGGLCVVCQRMYDFQRGRLNFDLERLKPKETWPDKLERLMAYFESDSQLRDILVTGGDALMSSNKSLQQILDAICDMAARKRQANRDRPDGEKRAEMVRVRLGTRLPVYLPQRITPEMTRILAEFKQRATQVGIRQFVIQTHFESPVEVTPLARQAIERLLQAGWVVTNQLVLTTGASRRGHTARLRQVLNQVGVLPYYTFSVKGYMENQQIFATNARAVQEQMEEKVFGRIPADHRQRIRAFPAQAECMLEQIDALRRDASLPFLATDRTVLNLPGVGKSLTFRVIGITRYGRRILQFEHDATRTHSPVVKQMGKIIVIESKSISDYLRQLAEMGEDPAEYQSLWGYSLGVTEPREPVYEYPAYDFQVTDRVTNLEIASH